MNALQKFLTGLAAGMDIIADCHGLTKRALIDAGCPDTTAARLLALADTYFGPTAFSRLQRESIAAARTNEHSLTALLAIERHATKLKSKRQAWALRRELCGMKGDASDVDKQGRQRVREIKGPPQRKPGVKLYRRADGPWTMTITGKSADIADMHAALDKDAPLDSVRKIFQGDAAASRTAVTTNVVLRLDELDRVVDTAGDDITLQLTNGARITGADLVRRAFTAHGYVTLIHPVKGPVNLYRTERLASPKQRTMAAAENPTCPWPQCNYPADECQVHHLTAWRHGGETNPENLTIACPYHNGVNDDDPNAPPLRGRLARVDGTIKWLPPWAESG